MKRTVHLDLCTQQYRLHLQPRCAVSGVLGMPQKPGKHLSHLYPPIPLKQMHFWPFSAFLGDFRGSQEVTKLPEGTVPITELNKRACRQQFYKTTTVQKCAGIGKCKFFAVLSDKVTHNIFIFDDPERSNHNYKAIAELTYLKLWISSILLLLVLLTFF